jgi:hypothetical protein
VCVALLLRKLLIPIEAAFGNFYVILFYHNTSLYVTDFRHIKHIIWGRRGRDRMVVGHGFTITFVINGYIFFFVTFYFILHNILSGGLFLV